MRIPRVLPLMAMFYLFCASALGAVWYVDKDNASGVEDGHSWATAFTAIQLAIDAAFDDGGGEIWVAEGIYAGASDPVVSMEEYVYLYGGFAGTETQLTQRPPFPRPVPDPAESKLDGNRASCVVISDGGRAVDGFTVVNGRTGIIRYHYGLDAWQDKR